MESSYLLVNFCTPPLEVAHPAWIHDTEKDDDYTKRKSGIQSCAEHHIVLFPPGISPILDLVVEQVTHHGPDGEVESGSWGYPTQATENNCEIDFAKDGLAVSFGKVPQDNWGDGTDGESPDEMLVKGAGTKEFTWSNNTP